MLKNAWAVGIPGTTDTGIEVAALLGVVLNRPEAGLELFSLVSEGAVREARRLRERCAVTVTTRDSVPRVYIHARVVTDRGVAIAETRERHASVRLLEVDGCQLDPGCLPEECGAISPTSIGTLAEILSVILDIPSHDLDFLVERAALNLEIARAGFATDEGIGMRALREGLVAETVFGPGTASKLALHAAAACDARMAGGGRSLPREPCEHFVARVYGSVMPPDSLSYGLWRSRFSWPPCSTSASGTSWGATPPSNL